MASRRNANRISGPRSALTDFLAANNISAAQIRDSHERRLAQTTQEAVGASTDGQEPDSNGSRARSHATRSSAVAGPSTQAPDGHAGPSGSSSRSSRSQSKGKDRANVNTDEDDDDEEGDDGQGPRVRRGTRGDRKPMSKGKGKALAKNSGKGKGKSIKGKGKYVGKGKGKKRGSGSDSSDDDDDDDDDYNDLGRDMYMKSRPAPGQFENCEQCSKRFTVTPYSKTGPEGGLLCAACGKLQKGNEAKNARANNGGKGKGASAAGRKRRKIESDRMDGKLGMGPKPLQQLCIEKVVAHHDEIEELGDLPPVVLQRLGMIFTKHRVLNSRTLPLFLRPDLDRVAVHDAAYLEEEDYKQLFAVVPRIQTVILHNACQFKDSVMAYVIEKAQNLKHLHLYAANLVSNEMWSKFIRERGPQLETLKLEWLDATFEDEHVAELTQYTGKTLRRLKLKLCRRLSTTTIEHLCKMQALEHLSLSLSPALEVPAQELVKMITALGPKLQTLSLERFIDADDTVLEAIRASCRQLRKLRFSHNDVCTDEGYASLFRDWAEDSSKAAGDTNDSATKSDSTDAKPHKNTGKNDNSKDLMLSPLRHADFSSTRDVNNAAPLGPDDPAEAIGLASAGLRALMHHAGSTLTRLVLASCRHISHEALAEVFCFGSDDDHQNKNKMQEQQGRHQHGHAYNDNGNDNGKTNPHAQRVQRSRTYPCLKHIDISFLTAVDEVIIAGIFRACPALERLVAFGCFNIGELAVRVPRGVVLIGVPRAREGIEWFGGVGEDEMEGVEGVEGLGSDANGEFGKGSGGDRMGRLEGVVEDVVMGGGGVDGAKMEVDVAA